jgi:AAA+ superfamily predicted ATPase
MADDENESNKNLLNQVIKDLGGVVFAVEAIDKILYCAGCLFKNNNTYQKSIRTLRGLNPLILTGHKIYTSIRDHNSNNNPTNLYERKRMQICHIMGFKLTEAENLDNYDFMLGREIISWFLHRPNLEKIKVINFYNAEFEIISAKNIEKGEIYILLQYDNTSFCIETRINIFNNQIYISDCEIYSFQNKMQINELKNIIYGEFIKSFNTKQNIIEINKIGLQTRIKKEFNYEIYQFDIHKFCLEVENALQKKKKRGYLFVGPPGVGKSTVLVKLEKQFDNIPIVYLSTSLATYGDDVTNTFNFLRSISPCICIWEDFDCCELTNKRDKVFNEFLDQMDSLKHQEAIIIIATVNETNNIHPSLINRRGRFDKVYYFNFPQTKQEFLNILSNKYEQEFHKTMPEINFNNSTMFTKLVDNKFTHSDLCECIDSLIINNLEFNDENLEKQIDEVINSMRAINQCQPCNIILKIDDDEITPSYVS